ncbi:alpha/beta hydrolase [Spiroplasma apis]|uniref:Serine aminopeptidase S33 domain-containing protein n=1 Tax=Spiroplasma apis B31 TaxID=1276258 RepID=V5RGZ5_SPIAP|nr:alpha/beta fold hydrolase [Spiroplasma apis]AHB35937.1 hypothetical protein SAPIS_v1c00900 [Spiroplasma apis B31]
MRAKKFKPNFITKIRRVFYALYLSAEKAFRASKKEKKQVEKKFAWLLTTNKVCEKYYKREELKILDLNNLSFIDFNSRDGISLKGVVYEPNKTSNKWVIASHWFAGHKLWSLHHSKVLSEMGYNILAYDFRGHADSKKAETYMGAIEFNDLMGAFDWLKSNKKIDKLILHGTSMGAYVSNFCAIKYYHELIMHNLIAVISDCTYGSVYNLFLHVRNVYLKIIPKRKIKKLIQKNLTKYERLNEDINLTAADIFKLMDESDNDLVPTLFIHSKDDKVTPPADTYELLLKRSKICNQDEHLVFNYAMHTQSLRNHFKKFNYKIIEFISKIENLNEDYSSLIDKWRLLEEEEKDKKSVLLF